MPGINLLQGFYAQRSNMMAFWPAWRVVAVLLATLGCWESRYRSSSQANASEIAALDRSIDQAFHYVFPDAGPVQDPRAELSSRLQQLGGQSAGGSHEFLDTLRTVAQVASTNAQTHIEAVNYRAGTMELRIRAPTVEALDRIQQAVGQAGGMKAKIQTANAAGTNEVVGRLQITRSGS